MSVEANLSWFHGKLPREVAEQLLRNGDLADGRFLVRESSTAIGDYVLSILHEGDVVHYQIRKHGGDAFFSIDDGPIIHGLERLVDYYREDANGLVVQLGQMIRGRDPPADCRLHGRTNLLHRATKEGDYRVVDELLKSGYHSLDAKNRDGQTALHLACILGHDDIVRRLIQVEANVDTRDCHGLTPLHYACQTNRPFLTRILIDSGCANHQARSFYDGWVAMHEAASRGHAECVKVLLAVNAPCHPRTDLNETPNDLAIKNGHYECANILENYKPPPPKTVFREWFHGNIGREQTLDLFEASGFEEGLFLVRCSSKKNGVFVLSVVHLKQAYHYEIQRKGKFFFIDNGPYLESLEHIVWYYSSLEDGLPTKLRKPIVPSVESVPNETPTMFLVRNPLCDEEMSISSAGLGMDLNENRTMNGRNSLNRTKQDLLSLSLNRESIVLENQIGEGEFGDVFCGYFTNEGGEKTVVAIKTLRDESIHEGQQSFIKEASVMINLKHPCIVELLGFCLGPPMMLVQELMCGGSLLDFLQKDSYSVSNDGDILPWALDITDGMVYLEQKHFVHRDLASRNILLTSAKRAKITDFGLSRAIGLERNYYQSTHGGKWPVKWYALESVNFGTFSHASDVWSFGVTLWEMYSSGQTPYGNLTGAQVIQFVEDGSRLNQPRKCPNDTYELMLRCWAIRPEERPTFSELKARFGLKLSELNSPSVEVKSDSCETVHEYNVSERCEFVRNNEDCQCAEGFFNYINFIYCDYDDDDIVRALSICGVWSCFLFTILGITADKFFCPSLTVIAKSMRLSQNVAGVTFLAFGNGASDIFASLAAATQNRPELVISGLFGAGIFVTCAVSGAIMIATPFKIKEEPFLRDIIFYLAAAYWAFSVYYYGRVRPIDAFGFLGLYVVYILVVLFVPYFYKKIYDEDIEESRERIENQLPTHYTQKGNLTIGFEKDMSESTPLLNPSSETVAEVGRLRTCLRVLSPVDTDKWNRAKWYMKVVFAIKAPAIFVLKMTIPLIDYDAPHHNWSQILNAFHCVVGPSFLIIATRTSDVVVAGMCPIWFVVIFIGLVAGVLVLFTSSHPQPPAYHAAFGYLGFAISIVWIYIMANEIVNVLKVMGIVLNINDAILGLTILAWGNSIGDFVANFSVAKKGSPMMGISACYGGPVFNLLVGMGLPFTIETFRRPNQIKLIYDPSVTILSAFLFASLVSTLVAMLITGFHVRRFYGFYLLFLYIAFVACAIINAARS